LHGLVFKKKEKEKKEKNVALKSRFVSLAQGLEALCHS
jgi:hypothetical protein